MRSHDYEERTKIHMKRSDDWHDLATYNNILKGMKETTVFFFFFYFLFYSLDQLFLKMIGYYFSPETIFSLYSLKNIYYISYTLFPYLLSMLCRFLSELKKVLKKFRKIYLSQKSHKKIRKKSKTSLKIRWITTDNIKLHPIFFVYLFCPACVQNFLNNYKSTPNFPLLIQQEDRKTPF